MMNKSSRNVMTFNGGIHPAGDGKKLSSGKPVQTPPLLEKYFVLLAENAGKPPKCIVKKGEHIQKYQLIAQQHGVVSANLHAPTSGTVADIKEVPGPMGVPSMAVEISADGEDRGEPPMDTSICGATQLIHRIHRFWTHNNIVDLRIPESII